MNEEPKALQPTENYNINLTSRDTSSLDPLVSPPVVTSTGQSLLASRNPNLAATLAAAETPFEESRRLADEARDALGVNNGLAMLQALYPDECKLHPELMAAKLDPDNRRWQAGNKGSGDVVILFERVLGLDEKGAASLILTELADFEEEDRLTMAPEYVPDPNARHPFPVGEMPPVMRELADKIAETNKSKPDLALITMLGLGSVALGKGIQLTTTKGRHVTGNLYVAASMSTGTGKTSEAGPLMDMMHDHQRQRRRDHLKQLHRKQAELTVLRRRITSLEVAASSDKEEGDKEQAETALNQLIAAQEQQAELLASMEQPSVVTEDATSEALVKVAAANNGLVASMSTNARDAFENLNGRYAGSGQTGASFFIKGFSGDAIEQARVSRASVSTKPRVTVLWLVQPDRLKGLFAREEFRIGGLAPRFLVCHLEPTMTLDTYEDVAVATDLYAAFQSRLDELLTTYYQREGKPYEIKPTVAAGTAIVNYGNRIKQAVMAGELEGCEEFAARWAEQAWRIALVLHAFEHGAKAHESTVEERTARAAIKAVEWFSCHQVAMLAATSDQKTEAKLGVAKEWVRAHPEGCKPYDVYRKNQGVFDSAKDAKKALEELVAEGSINRGITGKGVYVPLPLPKRR